MKVNTRLIRDFDEFLKLREPWNELAKASEVDHAFMRHEWFTCWLRNLGDPRGLRIQTLWADGQLVAAAPMQLGWLRLKKIPLRVLSFLSSSISPRCNFIIHSSCEPKALFDAVFDIRGWDLTFTPNLEAEQNTTRAYWAYLEGSAGRQYETEPGRLSPYQPICGSWENYYESLTKNHRKNIKVAFKRLEEAGSHSFEQFETYEEAEKVFDRIVAISGASWKAKTGSDLKSNKAIASFYKDFSREGSPDGLWKLYMLKIDSAYVAFDYLLKHNRRLTGIRSDYDLAYKDYMPGHLLKVATIKDLCSKGEPWEFDMGGMAVEYKLGYANEVRQHLHATAGSRAPYGKLLMFGKMKVWPLYKKILGKSDDSEQWPITRAKAEGR